MLGLLQRERDRERATLAIDKQNVSAKQFCTMATLTDETARPVKALCSDDPLLISLTGPMQPLFPVKLSSGVHISGYPRSMCGHSETYFGLLFFPPNCSSSSN